jgi:MarR family transcriptional regulator for hemolysin
VIAYNPNQNSPLHSNEHQEIGRELAVLARRWRQHFDLRLKEVGLGEARWSVLYWLSRAPQGLSQTALAEEAGVDAATLVRTIDLLQKQGLVERRPSARDRRVNVVVLTEAAARLLAQVADQGAELWHEVMSALTLEEQRTFLALMRRIRARLESLGANVGASPGSEQEN